MTKNELRNGMLVKHNNGHWGIIADDKVIHYEWLSVLEMQSINNDLTYNDEWDISLVAEVPMIALLGGVRSKENPEKLGGYNILWTRSNPKIAEVESLISKLQSQLEAAKEELEALR